MRLIDADKLSYYDIKCVDGSTYMVVHAPEIDNAPTAYDADKVVEQLEKLEKTAQEKAAECDESGRLDLMDIYDAEARAYKDAMAIVKLGGID